MDKIKVTLTPTELGDIIDRAFKLGKMYAADELDTTDIGLGLRPPNDVQTPVFIDPTKWDEWIESRGGHTLNAGDAKLDILWESCSMKVREAFKDAIEY